MKIKLSKNGRISDIYFDCEISIADQQYSCSQISRNVDMTASCYHEDEFNDMELCMLTEQNKAVWNLNGLDYQDQGQLIHVKFFKSSRMLGDLTQEDVVIDIATEDGNHVVRTFYTFMDWIPAVLLKDIKETAEFDLAVAGMVRTKIRNGRFVDYPCVLHLHCTAYQLSTTDEMFSFEQAYSIVTSVEPIEEVIGEG